MAEAAFCLDLKASFFQVSLPRETRHLFRCRVEDGTLVELTRVPMGYKAGPEILQIITSAIAGVTTVAHALRAAPPLVRIDVWIDNIRIAGPKSDVTFWEAQVIFFFFLLLPVVVTTPQLCSSGKRTKEFSSKDNLTPRAATIEWLQHLPFRPVKLSNNYSSGWKHEQQTLIFLSSKEY
ncbi:hypothetical protein TcBrA4_0114960 [Trypanosoma cruzi]|nr:hypothetical protein TcBrA4_0114960 [Trypanosoma cruzi]